MTTLEELDVLYTEYLRDMERFESQRSTLRGAFGSILGGVGSGTDTCNDRFAEGMEACLTAFRGASPSSEDAAAVMGYVIEQPRARTCPPSAGLMLQAAAGFLLPLAERLAPADADRLLALFEDVQKGEPLTPVQKALKKALKGRARGK